MPSHPPETPFYTNDDTDKLWRDISRTFEDFCGDDDTKYAEKEEAFKRVLHDVLDQLAEAKAVAA